MFHKRGYAADANDDEELVSSQIWDDYMNNNIWT